MTPLSPQSGSALPLSRLNRHLAQPRDAEPRGDEPHRDATDLVNARAWLAALTILDDEGVGLEEIDGRLTDVLPRVASTLRLPMTVALPGMSPRYGRLAKRRGSATVERLPERYSVSARAADVTSELHALALVVAHRAAANESTGVLIEDAVPPAAFHALADLERHWEVGPTPQKVEKLRDRLDQTMKHLWTTELRALLHSTSHIDAFTNFPIGLLRPPGSTAPLAARVPIAYHPISPVTRALQIELGSGGHVDFSKGFSVLIVECISADDRVGAASRRAWKVAEELSDAKRSVSIRLAETLTVKALREAVARYRPDILVISAHGFYSPELNTAGLLIGKEKSLGTDLGPMPALVILSACHSAPRGGTGVAVTDLLLWAGAKAVVSTLVPVDVIHNSVFMTRLLVNLSDSVAGAADHKDLLGVWHRVQSSNAIVDIANGNGPLKEWAHTREDSPSPIIQFMRGKSKGRPSLDHIYRDTESVLLEIAAEQGIREKVAGWLRAPGYLPESMMYTLVGDASAIRLQM